jgi:SSS family solute:Na+ symporter
MSWIPVFIIFAWLALSFVVGVAVGRRKVDVSQVMEEWYVSARSLGIVVLWFMLAANWLSAFSFLGGPGWAFSRGAPTFYIIVYCAMYPIFYYAVMPKVWKLGKQHGFVTQLDLFADRYRSSAICLLVALVSYAVIIPYIGLQMMGIGYLFKVATGGVIDFKVGALIAFGIIAAYVYTSGLRGVGWVNLLQGMMMFLSALLATWYIVATRFGGLEQMFVEIEKVKSAALTLPGMGKGMGIGMFATSIILSAFGGAMWPHMFQAYYGAKSLKVTKLVTALMPISAILNLSVTLLGLSGIVLVSKAIKPDEILIEILREYAPVWLLGVLCAGGLAAAVSTGASLVHNLGSITGRNIYQAFLRPQASQEEVNRVARWTVFVITILSYLFALSSPHTLVWILLMGYGGISQFLSVAVGALFWPRATRAGALAGLLVGIVITGLFTFSPAPWNHPLGIHAGFWGLIGNLLVFYLVSKATQPDPDEILVRYFQKA